MQLSAMRRPVPPVQRRVLEVLVTSGIEDFKTNDNMELLKRLVNGVLRHFDDKLQATRRHIARVVILKKSVLRQTAYRRGGFYTRNNKGKRKFNLLVE